MTPTTEATRICKECGLAKPRGDYPVHKKAPDGCRSRCKPCYRAWVNAKHAADPETHRWRVIRYRYGITRAQYEEMVECQGGGCAICGGAEQIYRGTRLVIDHDHVSGRVRALLCSSCNLAVGYVRENPEIARSVVAYIITQHNPQGEQSP